MFFELKSFLYSLIFIVGLEVVAFRKDFIVFILIFLWIVSLWGAKKVGKKWRLAFGTAIFSVSAATLLYLIAPMITKQIFILLAGIMYYLSLLGIWRLNKYSGDQTARGILMATSTTSIFFFYSATYGIYLNFLVPLWLLMMLFLAATFIISYQYFRIIKNKEKDRKLVYSYSIILGMIMAEIAWVINFWPFGYLTAGIISLIFYYILWDLTQSYFLNLLSKRRVVANMIFFSFIVALVLLSSKWLPVV
jgi:hypothetical protein